jgi:hypothetical protein
VQQVGRKADLLLSSLSLSPSATVKAVHSRWTESPRFL